METSIVVGAGLVGALQAVYSAKKGHTVKVFERRPDLRKMELISGRSINLALSNRGWKALELAGIKSEIEKISIPMKGRMMHDVAGNLTFQPYGQEGEAIYSVSRGELNKQLLLLAEQYSNVEFHFNHRCDDVKLDSNTIEFTNTNTNESVAVTGDRIYATDGAFSAVRGRLQKNPRFNYSQTYISHGYKELTIPANTDGSHRIDKNYLHIWPRGEFMMIALPNLDGSFTCTLFFPFEGKNSFENLTNEQEVQAFFEEHFPDAIPHMPTLLTDYFENPTSAMVVVRCEPWNYKEQIILLGDAAHAIVPFYGQGMNSGFEDCFVLEEFANSANYQNNLFQEFAKHRKPDADAISDLALRNFIEMRDLVGDEQFLLQKKIEKLAHERHPKEWIPLYSMVTFSELRYSEALAIGKTQDEIMAQVMANPNIKNEWQSESITNFMIQELKQRLG